jgi:hypothetical protein
MLVAFAAAIALGERLPAKCAGWCNEWTHDNPECLGCNAGDVEAQEPKSSSDGTTSSATAAAAALTTYSYAQCIGDLAVSGSLESRQLVRNTGGGSSDCCAIHPIAAGARTTQGHTFELALEPRDTASGLPSRNGARVYLADSCVEGAYEQTRFAAVPLLGSTLAFSVDLSNAECGCNAAFYVTAMRQNTDAGLCDGDFYCDAANVCGVRCVELDLMEANRKAFHSVLHTKWDQKVTGGLGKRRRDSNAELSLRPLPYLSLLLLTRVLRPCCDRGRGLGLTRRWQLRPSRRRDHRYAQALSRA